MFFTQEGGNLRYLTDMRRTCSAAYTEGSAMHEGHLLRRFFIVFVYPKQYCPCCIHITQTMVLMFTNIGSANSINKVL